MVLYREHGGARRVRVDPLAVVERYVVGICLCALGRTTERQANGVGLAGVHPKVSNHPIPACCEA